jgi:hypothetical protein
MLVLPLTVRAALVAHAGRREWNGCGGIGMTIKVFLLDDHEVVRLGLRQLLESEPDIEVIGDTGTAAGRDRTDPRSAT